MEPKHGISPESLLADARASLEKASEAISAALDEFDEGYGGKVPAESLVELATDWCCNARRLQAYAGRMTMVGSNLDPQEGDRG